MGRMFRGVTLDIVRDADIHIFGLGGGILCRLHNDDDDDLTETTVSEGGVVCITAEANRMHEHSILPITENGTMYVCTCFLSRIQGAVPGQWTVPARRLVLRYTGDNPTSRDNDGASTSSSGCTTIGE